MGQKSYSFQFVGVIILVLAILLIGLNWGKPSPAKSEPDPTQDVSSTKADDTTQRTQAGDNSSSPENSYPPEGIRKHHRNEQNAEALADHQTQQDLLASKERYLKKILTRDESAVTTETLADGTELIHLNGAFAHVSAASVDDDGHVHVNCYDTHEGLTQGRQSDEPEQAVK